MNRSETSNAAEQALGRLLPLGRFEGEPAQFWARYLEALTELCGSERGCVFARSGAKWGLIANSPTSQSMPEELKPEQLDAWSAQMEQSGSLVIFPNGSEAGASRLAVAPLKPDAGNALALLVLSLNGAGEAATLEKLALATGIPECYDQRRQLGAARRDASRLANALDLLTLINEHEKFGAAAMALCNELASRFGSDRVTLGWVEKNYIVVKAMSHTEKIEPQMEAVQQLCALMEEACDQEEEVIWPRPEGQTFIARDHENFAKQQGVAHLATFPVFSGISSTQKEGETPRPVAAVTLERKTAFSMEELRTVRLMLDQVARPLSEMHRMDRWWGARLAASTRETCGRLLGAEHTWWKLLALAVAGALLVLMFGRKQYRIEGAFTLKTDAMAHFSAPFDGHIDRVTVRPGDLVKAGQTLVTLDTRELLLQKESAVAERGHQSADALKAESSGDVAGMRIARAREEQANAQLSIVNERLARAELKAPFDGVVVEGDLREKISAPVQKGELLLKVARIEDLYLVVDVTERDIQDVREGVGGQAAFASLPGEKFDFKVERIEPVARSKDKGNLFSVRCHFAASSQAWWRPGMSGIAKVDVGSRSLLWITTHRTVDFLRMWWW